MTYEKIKIHVPAIINNDENLTKLNDELDNDWFNYYKNDIGKTFSKLYLLGLNFTLYNKVSEKYNDIFISKDHAIFAIDTHYSLKSNLYWIFGGTKIQELREFNFLLEKIRIFVEIEDNAYVINMVYPDQYVDDVNSNINIIKNNIKTMINGIFKKLHKPLNDFMITKYDWFNIKKQLAETRSEYFLNVLRKYFTSGDITWNPRPFHQEDKSDIIKFVEDCLWSVNNSINVNSDDRNILKNIISDDIDTIKNNIIFYSDKVDLERKLTFKDIDDFNYDNYDRSGKKLLEFLNGDTEILKAYKKLKEYNR